MSEGQRISVGARVVAVGALLLAALVTLVLLSSVLSGGDGGSGGGGGGGGSTQADARPYDGPRNYEVKSGDTLSGISARTGVPVSRIESLNPGIDPQALIAGETLRLR